MKPDNNCRICRKMMRVNTGHVQPAYSDLLDKDPHSRMCCCEARSRRLTFTFTSLNKYLCNVLLSASRQLLTIHMNKLAWQPRPVGSP